MNTVARITAIILIILGLLVMLGGVATVVGGAIRSRQVAPATGPVRAGGLISGLALAAFLFVQGMIVVATGEGLYLLSDMARKMPTV